MVEAENLNLEKTLRTLRRRKWAIVLCMLLVATSALGFSELKTKQYTASATFLVRAPTPAQIAAGYALSTGGADSQRLVSTIVRLVTISPAPARTAHALGLTERQVKDAISVSDTGQTNLASVQATWSSPAVAARMATVFAQQSVSLLSSLRTGNPAFVQAATMPSSPSSPKVARNTIVGAVLGLLLGVGLAFLFDRLDRQLKEPEDLRDAFDLPLLGMVPESGAYVAAAVAANGKRSPPLPPGDAEAFRMLRAHLRYFNVDRDLRTVLVTSPASGDGKTTVARYLAETAATMGTRALLIEADLRRPDLARQYGLGSVVGLGEALIATVSAELAVSRIAVNSRINGTSSSAELSVLVAGATPPNPAELLESKAMLDLLRWAADRYELVVIDTPPLTVVSDAIPLLRNVDGVVVVSRLGKNTRDTAQRMSERLASLGAPVLGVVGNAFKESRAGGYEYAYAYYESEVKVPAGG